jgi:hypothetical protein
MEVHKVVQPVESTDRLFGYCSLFVGFVWLAAIGLVWCLWLATGRNITSMTLNFVASYFLAWGAMIFLSRRPVATWARRFLVVTVSLAAIVAILELFAVVELRDYRDTFATRVRHPSHSNHTLSDPELLHVNRPHSRATGSSYGDIIHSWSLAPGTAYDFDVRYDHHGFRNQRDNASAHVAVIGDGLIESLFVGQDGLSTSVLAKSLELDVVNLGQGWYGPQQELAVLRRFALPLKPSVCVWVFFEGNDLIDAVRYESARRDWQSSSLSRHSFDKRSFSRNALLRIHRQLAPPRPFEFATRQVGSLTVEGEQVDLYFKFEAHELTSDELIGLRILGEQLATAEKMCVSAQSKLVVAFAPIAFRVYAGICEFSAASRCSHWKLSDLPARLESVVREIDAGIGFIDLTPSLRAEASRGKLVYFPDDPHWNENGNRVAGEALSEYLKTFLKSSAKKNRGSARILTRFT